jgi:hypothetical protein
MATKGYDPVEEAKVSAPPKGEKRKFEADEEAALIPPVSAPVKAKAVVAEPVAPPVEPLKKYKVLADKNVSLNGAFTCVRAGQVIDPAGFGPEAVKHLLSQGVQMEEVA